MNIIENICLTSQNMNWRICPTPELANIKYIFSILICRIGVDVFRQKPELANVGIANIYIFNLNDS